jgi:hypothetical protein
MPSELMTNTGRTVRALPSVLPRIFIILPIVPVGDVPSGGAPDTVMRTDVVQCFLKIGDTKRQADDEGMKRKAKYPAAGSAIAIKRVKVIAHDSVILLSRMILAIEDANVIHTEFIGYDDHAATLNPHRRRLFVVAPIANVLKAFRGEMIGRVERFAESRT